MLEPFPGPDPRELRGTVHVVSHTHWDREWYLTYQTFRVRLVRVVDQVLDLLESHPRWRHFMLDGQAVALEDYLEIRPEAASRVRRLVEEGRLAIGPWYILPDQFLVSGEATARNLLLGRQACAPLGGAARVGYMPDTFGHIAQLPQLLRRAGLDSFIYWRGHGDEVEGLPSEWEWRAPDGSPVLAVNQVGGYCNGSALGYEEIWEIHVGRRPDRERAAAQFLERLGKVAQASSGDLWLLNNGCDHHPPQAELPDVLERVRELAPGLEVLHTPLAEFVQALRRQGKALPAWSGELRAGRQAHLLSGVLSARMYLKQANERCQRLLAEVLEPLDALAALSGGSALPEGLLREAWRLLLRNHPHDSICGCSIDEVHTEMESRFDQVLQLGEEAVRQVLGGVTPLFAADKADDVQTCLTVWNPLPFARHDVVSRWVVLLPEDRPVEELELVDAEERSIPFTVARRHHLERFWGIDYRSCLEWREQDAMLAGYLRDYGPRIIREAGAPGLTDQFLLLEFQPLLPALSCRHFRLRPRRADHPAPVLEPAVDCALVSAEGAWMENSLLKVWLKPDGRLDILHKASGRRWEGLGLLEDDEDAGDEYDWSPAEQPLRVASAGARGILDVEESGGPRAILTCRFAMELPAALEAHRRGRTRESVECPLLLRVALTADSPLVDVELELDNRAKDHRLRFVAGGASAQARAVTHNQFELRERPFDLPDGTGWVQPPLPTVPVQEFAFLEEPGGEGLALFNLGLPEVEPRREEDGRTALVQTLLRCVGWLSRDDLSSRRCQNAGPTLPTPGAQCLGRRTAKLALMPYAGGWRSAGVRAWSRRWRVEPLVRQGVVPGARAELAPLVSQARPEAVEITCLRLEPQRGTLILRLCNLSDQPLRERLSFVRTPRAAWLCNLVEERELDVTLEDGQLSIELAAGEIRTLEVDLEG